MNLNHVVREAIEQLIAGVATGEAIKGHVDIDLEDGTTITVSVKRKVTT